jgi:hypothetical protein
MNDNENNVYIVQCTKDNFDDVQYMVKMFVQVVDIDPVKYCIKTISLDSIIKKRLCDAGASFWQEPSYAVARSIIRGRL